MRNLNIILFLLAVIKYQGSDAFCVYNNIRHRVYAGVPDMWQADIAPGDYSCCHWSECGGSRDSNVQMWLSTSTGATQIVEAQAGGCIEIVGGETSSRWNWPIESFIADEYQSISYKINPEVDGKCTWDVHRVEPRIINKGGSRSVHFLVTADPQYWLPSENKAVPDQTIATMRRLFDFNNDMRGFIVAGDIVQSADYRENNFAAYSAAFEGRRRYLFDGIGNHDLDDVNGWRGSINDMLNTIGDRSRVSVTNKRGGYPDNEPDFSWNWDNVHFVQMNQYPGKVDRGLAWLKQDLETHVANSGNPVVMIHHYGFESFSRDWWTDDDRQNYWDTIKSYNVIAIFTGHLHTPVKLLEYWEGDYLNGAKVPFFISGAAMQDGGHGRGLFLEVMITQSELTVIRRYGNDGSEKEKVSVPLKSTTGKQFCSGCIGNGENQTTFENIPRNGSLLTIYPYPAVEELHVDVLNGNSSEEIVGVQVFDKNWNEFLVSGADIANTSSKVKFSISNLPPHRFYVVRIEFESGKVEQRIFWKDQQERKTFDP